jgi:hypothetical protein
MTFQMTPPVALTKSAAPIRYGFVVTAGTPTGRT